MTFSEELINCDGSDSTIVSDRSCTVPSVKFTEAPMSLPWGSSIYTSISAINIRGTSEPSDSESGAIILTNSDPPINVANDPSVTTGS